jgi:hypothetical protein
MASKKDPRLARAGVSGFNKPKRTPNHQKNALAHEIATMAERQAQELAKGQIEINKLDAKGNWFQSSWRPLAGYTCVLGLMVNFLISPIAAGFGLDIPQADAGVMMPLLLGMLGLGGARSVERIKGVGK